MVKKLFPEHDTEVILSILDMYGVEPYERERERVHLAILKLSKGDEDRLLEHVGMAKRDYRDVIMWAEYSGLA